jgi:U6 snRNA-associated Sm-like protein LSm6
MENGAASDGKDPSGFLSEIIGAPVTVKLNSGVVYKGKTLFRHRNITLMQY